MKSKAANCRAATAEHSTFELVCSSEELASMAGWRRAYVYWNDYPDYSHYRFARRLFRHWRRTVLWHRLLRRRWTRARHRHPADPALARPDLERAALC